MGILSNSRTGEKTTTMVIKDDATRFTLGEGYKVARLVENTLNNSAYPIVTGSIELEVKSTFKPGTYRAYLLHENGYSVGIRKKTDMVEKDPKPEDLGGDVPVPAVIPAETKIRKALKFFNVKNKVITEGDYSNVSFKFDRSVYEFFTDPFLTLQVIGGGVLRDTIGLKATRGQLIIAFLLGVIIAVPIAMWLLSVIVPR